MESNFDFNKIGKRMPYTTPDGFFDSLETDILKRSKTKSHKSVIITLSLLAAAACIASVILFSGIFDKPQVGIENVDKAFANLSEQDQDFLLDVYSDDVFINNEVSN